jgi:hypothetical protein
MATVSPDCQVSFRKSSRPFYSPFFLVKRQRFPVCPEWMLLTNSDLSAHAIDQLLEIVADLGLKHCLHILDLVNAF